MEAKPRGVAILGATGSIGQSALDVIRQNKERFQVTSLAVRRRWQPLIPLAKEFDPKLLCVSDEEACAELRQELPDKFKKRVICGPKGLNQAACADGTSICLSACSGAVGLSSTIAAIEAGIDVALANKEVLVAGGELVTTLAKKNNVRILPVDSEHSAVFQCIRNEGRAVASILLTASGGPFRGFTHKELAKVTVGDALKHPNWSMGKKITIDSASMMNKGLEVIEARWLFHLDYDNIRVVIHPQSIIHSLVEFRDSSVLAQMGPPDMRLPIQYALTYPQRVAATYLRRLDLVDVGTLTFQDPDHENFPCLDLAYQAGREGKSFPAVLNGANEVAVLAFLQERVRFLDIPRIVEAALEDHEPLKVDELDKVLAADSWAREHARATIDTLG